MLESREEIDKSSSVKEAVVSVAREVLTLSPEVKGLKVLLPVRDDK